MQIAFKKLNGSMLTPLNLMQKLDAKALLESATLQSGRGRYSILISNVAFCLSCQKDMQELKYFYCYKDLSSQKDIQIEDTQAEGVQKIEDIQVEDIKIDLASLKPSSTNIKILNEALKFKQRYKESKEFEKSMGFKQEDGFLEWLQAFNEAIKQEVKKDKTYIENESALSLLPFPLGGLGYLGFEFYSQIEEITFSKDALYDAPICKFMFGDELIIFDHFHDEVFLLAIDYFSNKAFLKLEHLQERILFFNTSFCSSKVSSKTVSSKKVSSKEVSSKIVSKDNSELFLQQVEDIKKDIYNGRFLQCVISRSLQIESSLPPFEAYINLRSQNPSPYMYYLNFDSFVILGASPEVALKCTNKELVLRPIAGTRKRGSDFQSDYALESELLADEKENAEHLMLVDLGRSDLGRVAASNSVKVTDFKIIEKYSKVMHIVSEVKATLKAGLSAKDALKATFPAGTVSGAPKLEAIKAISALEPHSRGVYSGIIGYFTLSYDLNSSIAIRTAVYQDGIYTLQAGAGIVIDSKKEDELLESNNKMQALVLAITKKP